MKVKNESGTMSIILVSQDASLLKLFEPAIISRLGASNMLNFMHTVNLN